MLFKAQKQKEQDYSQTNTVKFGGKNWDEVGGREDLLPKGYNYTCNIFPKNFSIFKFSASVLSNTSLDTVL